MGQAVNHYRAARDTWQKIVCAKKNVYQDNLTFGREPNSCGHWADRLPAIEKDLAEMEKVLKEKPPKAATTEAEKTASAAALFAAALASAAASAPQPRYEHLPAASFRRGEPLIVEMAIESGYSLTRARLHFRRVSQAEDHRVVEMAGQGTHYRQTIPGEYTDSPDPLMSYFEWHGGNGQAWFSPGLTVELSNQPYFVARQTS